MKYKLFFILFYCIIIAISSHCYSQISIHDGWPVDIPIHHDTGQPILDCITFFEFNEDTLIAFSTWTSLAVVDLEGNFLPGWPQEYDSLRIRCGPYIGDLEGDGVPDIIIGLRRWSGMAPLKRLEKLRLDGSADLTFRGDFWPNTLNESSIVLEDVDMDGDDEVIFATDNVHVVQHDGSNLDGFPWLIEGTPNPSAGPLVGTSPLFDEVTLFWVTRTHIYARTLDGEIDLPGWPVQFTSARNWSPPPVLIPYRENWVIATASEESLFVWTETGLPLDGFPFDLDNHFTASCAIMITVGDVNGDGVPEILLNDSSNDTRTHVVELDGTYLEGWPAENVYYTHYEPISIIRSVTPQTLAKLFHLQVGIGTSSLVGKEGVIPLGGFPVNVGIPEQQVAWAATAAIFPSASGQTLYIVQNTGLNEIYLWDYRMDIRDQLIEWGQPGNNNKGQRIYSPRPAFRNQPPRINYSEPEELQIDLIEGDSLEFRIGAMDPEELQLAYFFKVDNNTVAQDSHYIHHFNVVSGSIMITGFVEDLFNAQDSIQWHISVSEFNSIHNRENQPDVFLLSCYPNPFNNQINVSVQVDVPATYSFSIYDPQGRAVSSNNKTLERGVHEIYLRDKPLSSGVYFLEVKSKGNRLGLQKIVFLR
ncbi:T9SS type A sorting domain-containing protein [bacterium]|nr:T9SS type A sorting domain-containing protein [bacterium]